MRKSFRNARAYITALLVLEICLGMGVIVATGCYHRVLQVYLADVERKMLGGQFFNTYLLGGQLIAMYICGLVLWSKVWCAERYSKHLGQLLILWMMFCFIIGVCGCGTIWSLFICADAMQSSAKMSLLRGLDLYYSDPEWKLLWDGLQYHKECCGVRDYKDWQSASWMPPPVESGEGDCQEERPSNTILAPYACCKRSCPSCFENYIPRSGNSGIPFLNITQINTDGCLPIFTTSMWNILYLLLALLLISLKLDVGACFGGGGFQAATSDFALLVLLRITIYQQQAYKSCCMTDIEEHPLVVVKCPRNVRCLTLTDDECADFETGDEEELICGDAISYPEDCQH